jgi:hypothetical protein
VSDKTPLEQRTTEELERGLARGTFGARKKLLVEQILRERRQQEAAAEKKAALIAAWIVALATLGILAWGILEFLLWR